MRLLDIFEDYRRKKFVFITLTWGNQGDTLIRKGEYKLADDVGLEYKIFNERIVGNHKKLKFSQPIIYIHGAGSLSVDDLIRLMEYNKKKLFVIGPHTVPLNKKMTKLRTFDNRIIFFTRERTSYNFMRRVLSDVHLDLCPSFYHVMKDFLPYSGTRNLLLEKHLGTEAIELPPYIRLLDFDFICDPILYCRTLPRNREEEFKKWVQFHQSAKLIVTNRSHSAILGTILGKKVKIFRCATHKNRSLWEYCLRNRGVEWI